MSPRRAGARFCWGCGSAASRGRQSWRWATARWASGRRCRRSIRRPAASAAGCTRPATSSTTCRSPARRRRSKACTRSGWLRPAAAAERAFDHWIERYEDKYPKATACLAHDREELLAFYNFPAAHWTHLRTTNVIESAFATIRHRSSRAKGCVTRRTMLSMIYKMGMSAEQSWRRLRGFRQPREGHRGSEVQRRHRGQRGQQGRRMTNLPYTRFDNSSTSKY